MTDYYSRLGLKYRERTEYKNSILERDKRTCQLCGAYGDVVDHIKPWAESHDSSKSNLRCLCVKCNLDTRRSRKDANPFRSLTEWYAWIESELAGYKSN